MTGAIRLVIGVTFHNLTRTFVNPNIGVSEEQTL